MGSVTRRSTVLPTARWVTEWKLRLHDTRQLRRTLRPHTRSQTS